MTALHELPWMRRERCDANIRHAIEELRVLAREDTRFTEQYVALADAFQAALRLLDVIEDVQFLSSVEPVRIPVRAVH